jgi:hypothetical protein
LARLRLDDRGARVDGAGCKGEGGGREGGLTGGGGQREAPGFRRGQSLAGQWLSLQAGTTLRCFPGCGNKLRRCGLARRSSWRGRFAPTGDDLDGRDTSGGGHGGRLGNGCRWRNAGDGRLVEQGLGHVGARARGLK